MVEQRCIVFFFTLVPYKLIHIFNLTSFLGIKDAEEKKKAMTEIFETLPTPNRLTCVYLLDHLRRSVCICANTDKYLCYIVAKCLSGKD